MRVLAQVARRRSARLTAVDAARLIGDCEAFLSGRYASRARGRELLVPSWARLNNSAHGDLRSLRHARRSWRTTVSAAFANWQQEGWRRAERALAGALLDLVGDDPQLLVEVQREVLVPLELKLMSPAEWHLSVEELVEMTCSALEDVRYR